jgi:hypothetical protein
MLAKEIYSHGKARCMTNGGRRGADVDIDDHGMAVGDVMGREADCNPTRDVETAQPEPIISNFLNRISGIQAAFTSVNQDAGN